jgi:hypothetical protein
VHLVVRGDGGFAREALLAWCESQPGVSYCTGLPRNSRLEQELAPALAVAREKHCLAGGATVRVFREFEYETRTSWSRPRRVIGKAEVGAQGDNPRFIVTNLPAAGLRSADGRLLVDGAGGWLYEELYCARGQAENQIKQMTLDLQSGRTSTHWLSSNQLRLWLSAFAYLLVERLRAWGLAGTSCARASLGTIRLTLLKVAAQVTVSVRRVYIQLCSAFPRQQLFAQCQQRLRTAGSG